MTGQACLVLGDLFGHVRVEDGTGLPGPHAADADRGGVDGADRVDRRADTAALGASSMPTRSIHASTLPSQNRR